jgi:hypothetical protein
MRVFDRTIERKCGDEAHTGYFHEPLTSGILRRFSKQALIEEIHVSASGATQRKERLRVLPKVDLFYFAEAPHLRFNVPPEPNKCGGSLQLPTIQTDE